MSKIKKEILSKLKEYANKMGRDHLGGDDYTSKKKGGLRDFDGYDNVDYNKDMPMDEDSPESAHPQGSKKLSGRTTVIDMLDVISHKEFGPDYHKLSTKQKKEVHKLAIKGKLIKQSPFKESVNEQADYKYLTQVILDAKPKYNVYYNSSHNVVNIGGVGYDKGDLVKNFNQKPGSSMKIKNNFYHAHQDPKKTKREVEKLSKGKIKVNVDNRGFVSYSLNESVNEAKVNYNFSEDELKRVLKLLGRNASTEVKMIKAFEKAFGRKLTRDELFESVNEGYSKHFTYDEVVKSIVDFAKSKGYKIPSKGLDIIKGNPPSGPIRGWSRGTSIPLDKKINLSFDIYGVGKVFTVNQRLKLNKTFAESVNEGFKSEYKGNDGIVWKKGNSRGGVTNFTPYYKGHDIDKGGHNFKTEKELKDFIKDYILSNQLYKKYRFESVNEGISVSAERHVGKKGIIIMIDDNGKKVSAIFKDKKNADKFNRNNPLDIKKLLQLANKTKYPKAIDESIDEGMMSLIDAIRQDSKDVRDFVKNVFKDSEFKKMSNDKDFIKYLKSIYEGINEMGINDPMTEATRGVIHKAAKKGSYPVSLVVVKDGKVIKQVLNIKTPAEVPAAFNVVKNYHKHKDAVVHIEDRTGKRLFSESVSIDEKINLFVEENVPTDPSKWSYYKAQAKKKFDVYPSAYANGWAAKKYKAAGGGWKKKK